MSRTTESNVPDFGSVSIFSPITNVEPLSRDIIATLEKTLTPMERLIIGLDRLDPFAGIAWTGIQSRCVWRDDGRRITISLHTPRGYAVSVSIAPDPAYTGLDAPADQAVS